MATSRIMLVDDNADFLAVSREFLEQLGGYQIIGTAISGFDALGLLDQVQPDVLVIDLAMPEMNGLELVSQVRETHPDLLIIVLTLMDTPVHRQAALDAGANEFVAKLRMDSELIPAIQRLSNK